MNRTLCVLFLYLFVQFANAYYLNLGHFLKPILEPTEDIYGSALKSQNDQHAESISYFDSHLKRHRHHKFGINRGKKSATVKQNLRVQDEVQDDLYQAIGIPENIIYEKILPIHMSARRDLYLYFPKRRITKKALMESMRRLKELIEWISQTYLKEINTIIIGDNNNVQGSNIYIKGDNLKIKGTSDFVFNPNYENKTMVGNNIVRIGAFDVDLDQIDKIKRSPEDAIRYLEYN